MSDDTPKVFVAAWDGAHADRDLTIPLSVLREAERTLDAERERRKVLEAEKAAAMQAASERGWRNRLRAIFRRGRA